MDGENENRDMVNTEDPLKQNEEFLKYHKEIYLDGDTYSGETVERIEKDCGCQVICNPHFNGITFYVENEYYENAQAVINKIMEEEKQNKEREERLARRKVEVSKKIKQRFEEKLAACERPDDGELEFARNCLKTLKIKDYVQAREAERYRQVHGKYPEYFKLVGWPEDVEGNAAKTYINSTLLKNV
jgi:hypothetical protein